MRSTNASSQMVILRAGTEARAGRVTLDGQTLDYSDSNGFELTDPRHLGDRGPSV
jgi:hypothetical protein